MAAKIERVSLCPPKKTVKRAVGYCRVSVEKENSLHSLSAQISRYSAYIQQQPDWLYCGVYADKAMTGTSESRPEFQKMLTACRNGKIDIIITKSISRFARNTVTLLETVRELKSLGIDVYFEEQNIHSLSADGELMLSILGSFAQAESKSASDNMKWRAKRSFENGELFNLRFMFGYNISRDGISVNTFEAEIVRGIFQMVIDGKSLSGIARELNQRHIYGIFKGAWTPAQIKHLVQNEKYIGNALLQKRYRNNYLEKKLIKNKGELPMYYAENTHPPIVDKQTFETANQILSQIAPSQKKKKTEHEFTSLILCPHCGKHYRRIRSNHTGKYAWNCSTYISKGKAFCHGKAIPEEVLLQITIDVVNIPSFEKSIVTACLDKIIVPSDNHLLFLFKDGKSVERTWKSTRKSPNSEV